MPSQGSGLVGGHAYSLLDARELVGMMPHRAAAISGMVVVRHPAQLGQYRDAGTSG